MANVGTVEVIATIDTSNYKKGANEIERTNSNIEGSTQKTSSKMNGAFSRVAKVGIGALVAATVAAGAAIVKNIGGAINRIDTLVAFPRVLQALGVSSEEAESATDKLAESLRGLPTALGAGAKGVQGFVTSGLDVDKATRAFLAFNNAMLAASVETGAAQSTMQQLNQALSRGRIDGAEWNSIAANIPTVMQALQKETGKSKDELRELFRQDPEALLDNIIRLNEQGGGGLESLEKQARNATGGIGTAFANLDNAIQRGIQNIVTNMGGGDLEAGQRRISSAIDQMARAFGDSLVAIGNGLKYISSAINAVISFLQPLINYIKENKQLADVLKMTLVALAGIMTGVVVVGIVAIVGALALLTLAVKTVVNVFIFFMETAIKVWNAVSSYSVRTYNAVTSDWRKLTSFFSGIWSGIQNIFSGAGNWFKTNVVDRIVNAFNGIKGRITGFFSGVWSSVAQSLKSAVNSALNLPLTIPAVTVAGKKIGGQTLIPALATGGIVTSATLALIGEGSEPEAVIPLSKLDKMINGDGTGGGGTEYNIGTINIASEVDGERWLRRLSGNQEIVSNGLVPTQSYM